MVLEVKDLVKVLSNVEILHKVSFEIKKWEIYWFLGPNWAWKTTTMKCIMGLIKQESWTIKILWWSIEDINIRKKIWFMPENTYLYKYLTWIEFLKFNWNFFWYSNKVLDEKINLLLDKVWLKHAWNKYLYEYSKWMLQRIWLAQSIINDPEILFLDEPMSWLDPIWRKMVKDLLIELKKKWTTIFFNTHILNDVESICDSFSIINRWYIIVKNHKVADLKMHLEDFFIEKVNEHNKKENIIMEVE